MYFNYLINSIKIIPWGKGKKKDEDDEFDY